MSMEKYAPISGSTVTMSATATAAQATLPNNGYANHIVVNNLGPNYAYFAYGIGSITAQCSDAVIQPYREFFLDYNNTQTTISAVCDSGMSAIFKITEFYGA